MTDMETNRDANPRSTPDNETGADRDMEAAMSRALAPVVAKAVSGEADSEPKLPPVPPVTIDRAARSPTAGSKDQPAEEKASPLLAGSRPSPAPDKGPLRPSGPSLSAMPPPQPIPSAAQAKPQQRSPEPMAAVAAAPVSTGQARGAMMSDVQPMPVGRHEAPAVAPNRVYDHLVEGDDDVIGLITYSLYKKDKRDWIIRWREQHGTEPAPDQVEAFVAAQMTFAQRDRYRSAARQVLDAYASVAVEMEKPLIVREGIAGRVDEAVKKVESSGRWWRQFPAALLGGMLATAIFVGIIAVLVAAGVDIPGYLGFQ
jgi:hypothetical protein